MGKLADLIADEKSSALPRCTVGAIIATASKDIVAELHTLLADESVTSADIASALTQVGHAVKPQTMRRHRRGECACGPAS